MRISEELKIYQQANMLVFIDVGNGFMQSVPKGNCRIFPYQSPDIGLRFVDINTRNIIAQITDWTKIYDKNGVQIGSTYLDTIEKLSLFFDINTTPAVAEDINYDNATSGLTATNVQDAIDELASDSLVSYNFSQTQYSKTLPSGVSLPNNTTANGFTFFSDATDRVSNGCTPYNEYFISFTRKLELTGNNGSALINVNGIDYIVGYVTSLEVTAQEFVLTHGASIEAATGIRIAAVDGVIRFADSVTTLINAITITNTSGALNGTFAATEGDHIVIPYTGTPVDGFRINHNFRVNFEIATGTAQTLALSLRRWEDDSVIGSEIPVMRSPDVAGIQETFISYTAGASDPFVTGGFYFALRNESGANITIEGNVGILLQNYFQIPIKF